MLFEEWAPQKLSSIIGDKIFGTATVFWPSLKVDKEHQLANILQQGRCENATLV